jgi:hypothetical protein
MSALHRLLASVVRHQFFTLRPKSFRVRRQGGAGTTDSSREANFREGLEWVDREADAIASFPMEVLTSVGRF